jgi:[acyl-carrier-protein] S-malonyltransferase
VVPANYNAPGQLVISGEVAGVERAMELAKSAGVKRAVRLQVSGAFHSPLMAPAVRGSRRRSATPMHDPAFPDPSPTWTPSRSTTAAAARERLGEQLGSPVRWTQVVQALARRHPDALFVEMGPGSVLVGLLKKIAPEVQSMTCGTAAEVEALRARLASPATA